ncbi:RluA family pseudouridine synthase [Ornithinibacillus halotolerans]|uniref:RNA pseudouridylate synthase n=1 Tax=Ornithinibacillus halotolerans TaxID=1274357 RepID=A0A916RXV5_9BACI|nr:RluA family pseudouridine synthase [Ornithinibacillus halotolerans]GGA72695.1 RNA pseudouridine synthase [Ornithinibacillus halotolerans]
MNLSILYEDNHLLLVEKPVNIPVQADNSGDLDFLTMLKEDIKVRYQKPGNVYLGLVHRLDRPVGGVMVFAKTSKAASRLSDMLRRRVIERNYLAVVHGKIDQKNGQLVHYLFKDKRKNHVYAVSKDHNQAKKAVLEYEVIDSKDNLSLLSVNLITGRPHQIRVQLSTIGHPLYGDQKYGKHLNKVGQQIALWAHSIHFEHPVKKEPLDLYSYPPNKDPWKLWDSILQQKVGTI